MFNEIMTIFITTINNRIMMKIENFFLKPKSVSHRQYEALRMYYIENIQAVDVADYFGYKYRAFTSIVSDFRRDFDQDDGIEDTFFVQRQLGRPEKGEKGNVRSIVVKLRKKNFSVEDIKISLDAIGYQISENTIYLIIKSEGFARLPKRTKRDKRQPEEVKIEALKSEAIDFLPEKFKTTSGALLCLLPIIREYGIDKIIRSSSYPHTRVLSRTRSILSFIALKLSDVRRYSTDDIWCMDRGSGLFAGLNVLPKATWFSSYSDRVTSEMNIDFLKRLHRTWLDMGLLSDTINLDFTTIPYWGEGDQFENNWSGKRNKALSGMLSVLAHDPDTGIIDYGNTRVRHSNESNVVLEFLDFYKSGLTQESQLKYIVFDSKFTNYENLAKLDANDVKFITIRRRGKNIVEEIDNYPKHSWKIIRVQQSGNKKRTLKVNEQTVFLKGYNKQIRQITITGNGRIKPAIIITNDFDIKLHDIVTKYARRWLVEKVISEQIEFFHLNRVSSSMVIKVDFDLTMSIVAHNIYRLFALELEGYSHLTSQSLYEKFITHGADVEIRKNEIVVSLKKKRNLPLLLETMNRLQGRKYSWLGNKKLIFQGATYT